MPTTPASTRGRRLGILDFFAGRTAFRPKRKAAIGGVRPDRLGGRAKGSRRSLQGGASASSSPRHFSTARRPSSTSRRRPDPRARITPRAHELARWQDRHRLSHISPMTCARRRLEKGALVAAGSQKIIDRLNPGRTFTLKTWEPLKAARNSSRSRASDPRDPDAVVPAHGPERKSRRRPGPRRRRRPHLGLEEEKTNLEDPPADHAREVSEAIRHGTFEMAAGPTRELRATFRGGGS